jgi:methionyl-tRNA formyltransferase
LKLIFAGTPEFAARHLAAIADADHEIATVITMPDMPGKRGRKPVPPPVKQLAKTLGLPVRQPHRLSALDIADLNADLMLVVAYGQILRNDVLQLPENGCINVHASLLPRWRGAAPVQRAIQAGDAETGICIMQMDQGLDTGDILLEERIPIHAHDTAASLTTRLSEVGPAALLKAIHQIDTHTSTSTPQRDQGMTYAKKIDKQEARIDWHRSDLEIYRQINAFNPDPVAFSYLKDLRVKIWRATRTLTSSRAEPGEITALSKDGIEVACGEGSLLITALQLPLGKGTILNGQDILNARRGLLSPGTTFS